jgi:glycosyltransferase involved in cell wall biosynthesis
MRIGIFTPYLDTMSGGERYMLTIAELLAKEHEVELFWDPKDEEKYKKLANSKLTIDIDTVKFTPNIFASGVSNLQRIKESRKYHKIIILSDGSIPFVGTDLYIHFQFPVESIKASFTTKFKAQAAQRIFCNSTFTKDYIDKEFSVKSIVLYPPVSLLSPGKKEDKIISVGRLNKLEDGSYFKRQDRLIEVFKKMVDSTLKGWRLVMVISTKNEKDASHLLEFRKIAKGYPISILHNPSAKELEKEYKSAKIYWHAAGFEQDLLRHPEWAEHFGITTVEAMSAGAIPVVFNAGGLREIVDITKNGYLWNTLDELEKITREIGNNSHQLRELEENAIKKAKQFSKENFKKNLFNMLAL